MPSSVIHCHTSRRLLAISGPFRAAEPFARVCLVQGGVIQPSPHHPHRIRRRYATFRYYCAVLNYTYCTDYVGINFALIAALSGLPSECHYPEGAPDSKTKALSALKVMYNGLIGYIGMPYPSVGFYDGELVAPSRFASTLHFQNSVRF